MAGASSPTTITKVAEVGGTTCAEFILIALRSSKTKQMGLRELYKWFETNTDRGTRKGRRNSVRSHLCVNKVCRCLQESDATWPLLILDDKALERVEGKVKTRRQLHSLRWGMLSNELSYMAETKRVDRVLGSCLFSATHLASLLCHAAKHISDLDSPIASDLPADLTRFLTYYDSVEDLKQFAVPIIASSFILN
ncbi:hypothetical protein GCG54_00015380 [Colletotrichum gloeosporioides]|uniref:Uncharacterized protein n=1 Tax=Colletotrichum gloeosporioides TaxID=474922 RepID=A0A8H4FMX1_COLGL|nr:uncharacterized protein GCG54_00015380 [Colletotrichum gloeosporioides]KAF3807995.1 hypothetical protein GCG54_00015380 [Colletotrichum gloeosporioides]